MVAFVFEIDRVVLREVCGCGSKWGGRGLGESMDDYDSESDGDGGMYLRCLWETKADVYMNMSLVFGLCGREGLSKRI